MNGIITPFAHTLTVDEIDGSFGRLRQQRVLFALRHSLLTLCIFHRFPQSSGAGAPRESFLREPKNAAVGRPEQVYYS
jgi:hypothetical protein